MDNKEILREGEYMSKIRDIVLNTLGVIILLATSVVIYLFSPFVSGLFVAASFYNIIDENDKIKK